MIFVKSISRFAHAIIQTPLYYLPLSQGIKVINVYYHQVMELGQILGEGEGTKAWRAVVHGVVTHGFRHN